MSRRSAENHQAGLIFSPPDAGLRADTTKGTTAAVRFPNEEHFAMKPIRILTPLLLAVALVSCASSKPNRYGDPTAQAAPGTALANPPMAGTVAPVYATPPGYGATVVPPPPPPPPLTASPAPPAAPTTGTGTIHTVVAGDTLWGLSRQYKVPVESIKQANGMTSDTVMLGSKLVIPPR